MMPLYLVASNGLPSSSLSFLTVLLIGVLITDAITTWIFSEIKGEKFSFVEMPYGINDKKFGYSKKYND